MHKWIHCLTQNYPPDAVTDSVERSRPIGKVGSLIPDRAKRMTYKIDSYRFIGLGLVSSVSG